MDVIVLSVRYGGGLCHAFMCASICECGATPDAAV